MVNRSSKHTSTAMSTRKGKGRYYPVAKRVNVYGRAAGQLAKDVAYIASLVNSELHYLTTAASDNIDQTGDMISLAEVPQGDTPTTRTGNKILPRYLNVKLSLRKSMDPSAPTHETVRVMIFQWWGNESDNATPPTKAEVLGNVGTASLAPLSHLNDNNTGRVGDMDRRIKVLYNAIHTFDLVSETSHMLDWNYEMNKVKPGQAPSKKQHIKFIDGSAQNVASGNIWLMIFSDNPDANAYKSAYYFQSKLSFYDN